MPRGITEKEDSERFDPIEFAREHYPDDPAKFLARYYDNRVIRNGGSSIFRPQPRPVYVNGNRDRIRASGDW